MPSKLNREAFQRLVDEDLEWLMKQPRTLEREHIALIVRRSVNYYDLDYAAQEVLWPGSTEPKD